MERAEANSFIGQTNTRLDRLEKDMVAVKREKSKHDELIDLIGSETGSIRHEMGQFRFEMDQFRLKMDQFRDETNKRFQKIDEQFAQVHSRISMVSVQLNDKIDLVGADLALVLKALNIKK